MSELKISSEKNFTNTINEGITLVDFNAPWCGPCRAQDPIIKKLEKAYDGKAKVATVDIDNNREIALNLGIQSIPTLVVFKQGVEVQRMIGLQCAETLYDALNRALSD